VAHKGRHASINVRQYRLGNKRAEVLSAGLKLSKAKQLNMSENRLSPAGATKIITSINRNLKVIDLSKNSLGGSQECIDRLCDLIMDRDYGIQSVNLS